MAWTKLGGGTGTGITTEKELFWMVVLLHLIILLVQIYSYLVEFNNS
jgi:hypothetical protein